MGSVSAAEMLNLETYDELNFLPTTQKYQKEAEIGRILNQWKDKKTISNTNYFENIKNKC